MTRRDATIRRAEAMVSEAHAELANGDTAAANRCWLTAACWYRETGLTDEANRCERLAADLL